ncbi:MAG: BNR/Asp-box repeat-containing protein [Bacteroidetes bacterium]|nr:MAG: BNR/Asp-box repeat-containing protein [Bacteroidota bacterium]
MKESRTILTILMLLSFFGQGIAQSFTSSGPNSGNITSIAATSTLLFAGAKNEYSSGGAWTSADNGQTWNNVIDNIPGKIVQTVGSHGDVLFVATQAHQDNTGVTYYDGGIYRSDDNGLTWTQPWPQGPTVIITSFYSFGTSVFAGTGTGPYRSINNGVTWTLARTGLNTGLQRAVKCFFSSGDTLFLGTRAGVYRSVNNGTNWIASTAGIPLTGSAFPGWITGMTKFGSTLYASTYDQGVFKSTDKGITWVAANTGLPEMELRAIYATENAVFTSTKKNGVYKSMDNGATWTQATSGLPIMEIPVFLQSGNNLFAGGFDGIFKTTDNGLTWTETNNNLAGHAVWKSTKAGPYLFAGTYSGRVYRSSDNGTTWQSANGNLITKSGSLNYVMAMGSVGNTVFAAYYDSLYRSTDFGVTWASVTAENVVGQQINEMFTMNSRIYLSIGVYSDDEGLTWTTDLTLAGSNNCIKDGDRFAGGSQTVYRSVSGTQPFTAVGTVPTNGGARITCMATLDNKLYVGTGITYTGDGVYESSDNGVTWTKVGMGDSLVSNLAVVSGKLFAKTMWSVQMKSAAGNTWINVGAGLPYNFMGRYSSALFGNNDYLFAGIAARSLYKADVTQFVAPSQPSAISGSAAPCIGSTQTYSVTNVPGVTYIWQPPVGWTITSGQNTSTLTVVVGSIPGTVIVTPSNVYGVGPYQYMVVMPNTNPPAQPGAIAGSTNPMEGSSETYSVTNDPGVSYAWTFPSGWVQTGGGTTNEVTVTVGSDSGNITATPSTACGSGMPRTLAVVPTPSGFTVTFNVDMSTAEGFTPGTDLVYLTGNFPGASWITPGDPGSLIMAQVGSTLVYTYSLLIDAGTYEYKYFKNAGWDDGEYTGGANRLAAVTTSTSFNDTWGGSINWANLQWPGTGSIALGGAYDVYAQAYIPNGITANAGGTYGLQAWIGYSSDNTDPNTWTNWIPAPFFGQGYANDEFKADLGSAIAAEGTYYYVSRFRFGNMPFVYGGFNGGFWDGTTNISGVLTINANDKTLTLNNVMLEGLYAGGGFMNQAFNEVGPQFDPGVADMIAVELHDATNYATIEYSSLVQLSTTGTATVTGIPVTLSGDYRITVKHRNSIETTTANAVSFAGTTIIQSFGDPAEIYGGNLLQMADMGYAIYGGDINQDGAVDGGDVTPFDNDQFNFVAGYVLSDVDGNGSVDSGDGTIIDNNQFGFVGASLP